MSTLVITSNLGGYTPPVNHTPQKCGTPIHAFTDENFPPRSCAMTSRLQARIIKTMGWQLVPIADKYIYMDASFRLAKENSVEWLVSQLGNKDTAFFHHPDRNTIREEAEFLRTKSTSRYIQRRYHGEQLDAQLAEIFSQSYNDTTLYAGGVFIYMNTPRVHNMLKEWWYHNSRYHLDDQLSLPYCLHQAKCTVNTIEGDIRNCEYIPFNK